MSTTTKTQAIQYRIQPCATGSHWEIEMKVDEDDTWTLVLNGPREAVEKRFEALVLASLDF